MRMGNVFDAIPCAVIAVDKKRRIRLVNQNAAAILAMPPAEAAGHSLDEAIREVPPKESEQFVVNCLETGAAYGPRDITLLRDSRPFPARQEITPIYGGPGQIAGALITIHVSSSDPEPAQLLRQLEALSGIGEMAAGAIHEVRNPLTSIGGFVQLLKIRATRLNDLTAAAYCTLINEEISHINNILTDFLTLAKPPGNKFAPLDLLATVRDALSLMYGEALLAKIELIGQLPEANWVILGNNEKIKEVLINLIRNAFQAMDPGGVVTVAATADERHLTLAISDTGCGIPLSILPNIFRPFFTTKDTGTGLGLAISEAVMREHGGKIAVASIPGQGSTFTLVFPRLEQESP